MKFTDEQLDALFRDGPGNINSAIVEAQPNDMFADWTDEFYRKVFLWLPFEIQVLAVQWGLSDTEFGDRVFTYLQEKGIPYDL
jgi:hypothetical protein